MRWRASNPTRLEVRVRSKSSCARSTSPMGLRPRGTSGIQHGRLCRHDAEGVARGRLSRACLSVCSLHGPAYPDGTERCRGVPGNHDVIGLSNKSNVPATDPLYGKKFFEDCIGKRYRSFDHEGWHFVSLDSIGVTSTRGSVGLIDEKQLEWLRAGLKRVGTVRPIVVLELLRPHNVKAVSGNWWKGPRLGRPEGFAVLTVTGGEISWRYETYGFQAV
jgi:Icc protein